MRKARKISRTGIYHVMLRGINRQTVFYTKEDERKFIEILSKVKKEYNFKVFAYCFMGNHVHLLLKENESGMISKFMQSLLVRYVYWYNVAHNRCGTLFQCRFKSEAVETAEYFQYVIRYIHRNPVKAKICRHVWKYTKSSYNLFFAEDPGIIDRDEVFDFIDRSEFEAFNDRDDLNISDEKCIDLAEALPFRLTNEKAHKIMELVAGRFDETLFGTMDIELIWSITRDLRKRGLSYGQISREIARNKGTIYKWVNKSN